MDKVRKKILIVDDDPQVHKMLGTVLIPKNYELDSAMDASRAWEKVNADKPDLIILDIMMPGMSGIEFCQKIKSDENLKTVLILMVSAKDSQNDRLKGLQYGAEDYVVKPFHVTTLVNKIGHLLSKQSVDSDSIH